MNDRVPCKPCMQYVGSKMTLAPRIISLLGDDHTSYVEPYLGSAAVLLAKPRVPIELVNDFDDELMNFFRVLRDKATRYDLIDALVYTPYARREFDIAHGRDDAEGFVPDPVERARRFLVRTNQRYVASAKGTWTTTIRGSSRHSNATKWHNFRNRLGAVAHRLEGVQIECTDALAILARLWNKGGPEIAVYLDPPYVTEGRNVLYLNDELTSHHERMLFLASKLDGPVVVSAYESELYDTLLGPDGAGWSKYAIPMKASSSAGRGRIAERTEIIWANAAAARPEWTRLPDVDASALVLDEDDEEAV